MKVGDKVFIVHSYGGWLLRNQYTPGVISKITPTGLIDVQVGPNKVIYRYGKNLREYGQGWRGDWIDTEMTFEDRAVDNQKFGRIDKAAVAISKVVATGNRRYDTKEELVEEIERLKALLEEANLLVQGV